MCSLFVFLPLLILLGIDSFALAANVGPLKNKSCHLQSSVDLPERSCRDMEREIKRCWFPPKGAEAKIVVVLFDMDAHGQVSSLHIVKPHGDILSEQAAMDAIKNAAPFEPCLTPKVEMQFTFDQALFLESSQNFHRWW